MYESGKDTSYKEKHNLIVPVPSVIIHGNTTKGVKVNITAVTAGHLTLRVNSSSPEIEKYGCYLYEYKINMHIHVHVCSHKKTEHFVTEIFLLHFEDSSSKHLAFVACRN